MKFVLTLLTVLLSTLISVHAQSMGEYLEKRVIELDGKELKRAESLQKPKKYYVFYTTASWCANCKVFTPQLVNFAKKYERKYGKDFSLVILSFDEGKEAQTQYSIKNKLTWPQLADQESEKFLKMVNYTASLPNLLVFTAEGEFLFSKETLDPETESEDKALAQLKALLDQ